jgi:hypothetical protein
MSASELQNGYVDLLLEEQLAEHAHQGCVILQEQYTRVVILCRIVANQVGGALSAPSQALGPSPLVALATTATLDSIETWATLGG